MAVELTKEQKEAIKNYGDEIKQLKDFQTAVRTRPGMYIGPIGNKGFLNCCREIYQNAIDQIVDQSGPGNWFSFYYDERTLEVVCEDNGRGLPFNNMIKILTEAHVSKNFDRKLGEYPAGMNGVGAKVVNALSTTMIVESYLFDGTAAKVEFHKGYPTTKQPVPIPNKSKKQGTKIYFTPDPEIMGEMNLPWKSIYRLLKVTMGMTPLGTSMDFTAVDINGKKFTEKIVNTDGIVTDLILKVKHPIIKPITIFGDDGTHKLNLAFCYDAGDSSSDGPDSIEQVTSFCNFCPTVQGTHVDGVLEGIRRWFTQYMNNIYLANQKGKTKVVFADINNGLNIMIDAAHLEPIFTGQAKEIISNEDMTGYCKEVVMKGLDEWSKANPQDLQKISKFFKDIAELRMKNEGARAKIVTKYHSNVLSGLPAKYKKPTGKKDIELIIVEGDSAMGSVMEGRDSSRQGIFPIRGKIINAFSNSREAVFANEEVQAITKIILGTDYKRHFKVEDCKVSKIIFMADADVDGAHISALLLRLFLMYFPQLIQAGMVYKAIPPLYSIKEGKKNRYFTEQVDIIRYIQKKFMEKYTVSIGKNILSSKDITLIFMNNADYIYYLERLANTYAVDPYLLEIIIINFIYNKNKINLEKLDKDIKSKYRFMSVKKIKNTIVVEGTIDKVNTLIVNDKFIGDCRFILDILNKNDHYYYYINGKKKSLYEIMKLYEDSTPSNISRYKGLGEMNKDQLAESTLYPGSDRTLVRYTLEDIKEEIEAVREYESDSKKILGLVNNVTRDDLLD